MEVNRDTLTKMFDCSIRAENVIHIGTQCVAEYLPSNVSELFRDGWDLIFKAMGLDEPVFDPAKYDFEELSWHLRENKKQGFLVQFVTPAPRNFTSAESYSHSWGTYATEWIYAETMQDACDQAFLWQEAYIKSMYEKSILKEASAAAQ
jgi:hypothetical protein